MSDSDSESESVSGSDISPASLRVLLTGDALLEVFSPFIDFLLHFIPLSLGVPETEPSPLSPGKSSSEVTSDWNHSGPSLPLKSNFLHFGDFPLAFLEVFV